MLAAIILAAVIDICFILDTFVFVPKGVDKFSRQHILDGDKTGRPYQGAENVLH